MVIRTYICIVKRFRYCPLLFTLDGYKQLGVFFLNKSNEYTRKLNKSNKHLRKSKRSNQ